MEQLALCVKGSWGQYVESGDWVMADGDFAGIEISSLALKG